MAQGSATCVHTGSTTISFTYQSSVQQLVLVCAPPSQTTPTVFLEQSSQFYGPFGSWANVQKQFGALGDGRADDTQALQAALDFIDSTDGTSGTLWFPRGTYRITAPLVIHHKQWLSILGEDPSNTTILWDGGAGATMLIADGSSVMRISRLTFDGANKADTAEDLTIVDGGGVYSTFNELSDQHLINLRNGIKLTVAAETTIKRVFFDGLSGTGILLGSFNTLNIFVEDSIFSHCDIGISNQPGAGAFMVRNSFFDHSGTSDMEIGNTGTFAIRQNTSINSRAFFTALDAGANNASITLQGNTVIDSESVPVSIGNAGALMLFDNIFRTTDSTMPAVGGTDDAPFYTDVFSMGNVFTTANPFRLKYSPGSADNVKVLSYDDSIVDADNILTPTEPGNVYTPPSATGMVFEVPASSTDLEIQSAINQAVASGLKKPIVHLPASHYTVARTISIPADTDLTVVGDGFNDSMLVWTGASTGAVLDVSSSSANLTEFTIRTFGSGDFSGVEGIRMHVNDQPGSRLFVNQLQAQGNSQRSIFTDGLEHATLEFYSTYVQAGITGIEVTGGPFRQADEASPGRIDYFSGSTQSQGGGTSLDVSNSGKLLVQDNWHDLGSSSPHNFVLQDKATLTQQASAVFMTSDSPFVFSNFEGNVSLLGDNFTGHISLDATSKKSNLLTLGLQGDNSTYAPQGSPLITVTNLFDDYYQNNASGHIAFSATSDDLGVTRRMLGQVRTEYGIPMVPQTGMASRMRIERVSISLVGTGLHVVSALPATGLFYTLENQDQRLHANLQASSCSVSMTSGQDLSSGEQWVLSENGDGDFQLIGAANSGVALTMSKVGLGLTTGDTYDSHWRMMPVGDGTFIIVSRSSGLALSASTGTDGCAQMTADTTSLSARWNVVAH